MERPFRGYLLTSERKSQLAIEYSYQIRSESPATWVFWLHASDEARLEESFRDIADQVKIPGRRDLRANIYRLVENWLRDEKKGKWICILDNADNHKFLCSLPAARKGPTTQEPPNAPTKPLLEYIPRSQNGTLIITSRSKEVALKMVKFKDLVEVNPMEMPEALELLQKMLDQPEGSQDGQKLVEELEFMPLAIVQAASFIRNRTPLSSVPQYLKDFQRSDCEATKLLRKEASYLDRDWEASNSILTTWQISFDYIRHEKPSAAELLSLMSSFDRQGIPERLIRRQPKGSHTSRPELFDEYSDEETSTSDNAAEFEDDITTLRDYSFISVIENGTSFTMHRLVQLTMRVWLKSHGETDRWRGRFISILYEEFPTGRYDNWAKCCSLFPHVRAAMFQEPESQTSLLRWATLLLRGAWFASGNGNIAEARNMATKSRKQRVKLLGAEGEEALESTAMLAEVYSQEHRWEEAEQLQVQVMETRKMKLGTDHAVTLASMASLASTYWNQGRWEDAEHLEVQVMETRKAKLGADDPDILTSMIILASKYKSRGRLEEAEHLEVQVMETRKQNLGADHPDTLTSMAYLALTYWNQDRREEAEQLQVQVIEKLRGDHPLALTTMNNLASTFCYQGRWEEAEHLQVQVMEAKKRKFGVDHFDTLSSMANLALTYWNQGRREEAEQLQMRVMKASKMKLGIDHPDTLAYMNTLALTFFDQGRWEEAEQLHVQVMETRKMKLGASHRDTLTSMNNLALIYRKQGRWEEAELLRVHVMGTRKAKLGEDHPDEHS